MIEPVVQISAIEHHVYCPRQCALIHGDGVWAENTHIIRGHRSHRRVDDPEAGRIERGRQVLRAVPLWSERYGLSGRSDVVEMFTDGTVVPVEYKAGVRHGQTADLQLCAQALCLEEMLNVSISEGYVWYNSTRRRHQVVFTEVMREVTQTTIEEIRYQLRSSILPIPPNDARCSECQLLYHCLPGVVADPRRVTAYIQRVVWKE